MRRTTPFFGAKFVGCFPLTKTCTAMNIKELLLNGSSFLALMKQYAIDIADIKIKDEEVLADHLLQHPQLTKETICIEGKNADGIINFFGTLHYNLFNKLAVFEMQGFDRTALQELS